MIEIEKPRIDCEELAEDGSYGKFVVEPLERGYGTTLVTPCVVSCCPPCQVQLQALLKLQVYSMSFPPSLV